MEEQVRWFLMKEHVLREGIHVMVDLSLEGHIIRVPPAATVASFDEEVDKLDNGEERCSEKHSHLSANVSWRK